MKQMLHTPVFDRPAVAFFGRTLAEYGRFFSLSLDNDLRGRSVLDTLVPCDRRRSG